MKRYYYIIIAMLTTVACEKSQLIDENSDNLYGGVIGYSTSVDQPTKAVESTITQLQQNGFQIATFVKESDDNYAPYYTDIVEYSGQNWSSGVNRYWPIPYTRTLDMFAHSPITADKDFVVVSNLPDRSQYSLTYTCPSDIDEQIDLLVATLTDQSYDNHSVKEDQTNTEAVGIEFDHALSAIKFTVKFNDEKNIELNEIRIHYIGIEKERTYNFATQTWEVPNTKSYFLGNETNASIVINETKEDINSDVFFDEINNQLMIIPQPITEGDSENAEPNYISIQIAYKIVSGTDTAPATSVETGWMPLPAPTENISAYEKGYAYTYNILVNSEEITLADVEITDQDTPLNSYGNIDLGLIETGITKTEYDTAVAKYTSTKVTDDGKEHLYYSTALRAARLLDDGVRDFVVIGNYGGNTNDGKLGYHGSGSSPFFISAESLGMMPEYTEQTDDDGNTTKEFNKTANADGSYTVDGVKDENLFSIDLRGVYNFPTLDDLHGDTESTVVDSGDLAGTSLVIPKYAFRDIVLLDEVIFPKGLDAIGDYAFENCLSLRAVDLADVLHVEPGGFSGCINLQTVNGNEGALTRIHRNAFDDCENLTTIDLTNVAQIGNYGFVNCYKLTDVNLSALSKVGESAFDECYELTLSPDMVNQTLKLTEVEKYAFSGCSKFVAQIDLTTATYVNEHAFNDCTEITFSEGNLNELVTIGNNAFTDCAHIGSSGIEITMPKIETIGAYAFKGCTYLNIVDGLENLDEITTSVFQECTSLTGYSSTASESEKILSLPLVTSVGYGGFKETAITNVSFLNESGESDKLTTIGEFAFDDCANLTTISGLDKVTSVGKYAFSGCSSLERLELPNLKDGEWGRYFFSGCTSLKILSLPQLTVNSITEDGSTYYSITDMINYSTSVEINLPALIVEVPGWGKFQGNSSLKTANFAAATSVGNGAFFGCTALEIVDLSSAITIGEQAFKGCEKLQILELPLATSVGANALSGCKSLETLSLPIVEGSFGGWNYFGENENLKYIDLSSVTTLNLMTFQNNEVVVSVNLSSATTIETMAFQGCSSLAKLNLSGLTDSDNIGEGVFWNFTNGSNCEIWLPSEQAENAVDTTWQGVTWKAIHYVESDGTCDTPFVLKSESEN